MDFAHMGQQLIAAAIFGAAGIGLFWLAWLCVRRMVRFSVEKELAEDNNVALGIVIGSMMLGIAVIVASAMR